MAAFLYVSHISSLMTPVWLFEVTRKISPGWTDLLRSEIMPDDILETLANPLLRDGGKVAFSQDIINNRGVFVAEL